MAPRNIGEYFWARFQGSQRKKTERREGRVSTSSNWHQASKYGLFRSKRCLIRLMPDVTSSNWGGRAQCSAIYPAKGERFWIARQRYASPSKICAMAIRTSSCVKSSNLFSASSISGLSNSLFQYFSEHCFRHRSHTCTKLLTDSALLDLLQRYSKNGENLDHYLNDNVHHFLSRPHFREHLETSEKHFNVLKGLHNLKSVLASSNILSGLRNANGSTTHAKGLEDTHRKENTDPGEDNVRRGYSC